MAPDQVLEGCLEAVIYILYRLYILDRLDGSLPENINAGCVGLAARIPAGSRLGYRGKLAWSRHPRGTGIAALWDIRCGVSVYVGKVAKIGSQIGMVEASNKSGCEWSL